MYITYITPEYNTKYIANISMFAEDNQEVIDIFFSIYLTKMTMQNGDENSKPQLVDHSWGFSIYTVEKDFFGQTRSS